jgi:hypothetical protein
MLAIDQCRPLGRSPGGRGPARCSCPRCPWALAGPRRDGRCADLNDRHIRGHTTEENHDITTPYFERAGEGLWGYQEGQMGQKLVRFAQLGAARSRQDESIEVHEVGSKRPSLGCNGVHVPFRSVPPDMAVVDLGFVLAARAIYMPALPRQPQATRTTNSRGMDRALEGRIKAGRGRWPMVL